LLLQGTYINKIENVVSYLISVIIFPFFTVNLVSILRLCLRFGFHKEKNLFR
jgi:hypothetical protein